MDHSVLAEMDRRFARIAVAKGYIKVADAWAARFDLINEGRDRCCPRTLPSVLLERNLITPREIDSVFMEMFDHSGNLPGSRDGKSADTSAAAQRLEDAYFRAVRGHPLHVSETTGGL